MNHSEIVPVSDSRLTKLETEVVHIGEDVSAIKNELSDRRETDIKISESLAKLTVIAEQNQKLEPKLESKIDALSLRISNNEKMMWKFTGAVLVIASLASVIGPWLISKI